MIKIFLRRWACIVFASLFLGVAFLYVRSTYPNQSLEAEQQASCNQTLRYAIGEVDPRFNIHTDEILAVLRESESVWEQPTGRNLLEYDEGAKLKINFVYGKNQEYIQRHEKMVSEYQELLVRYEEAKRIDPNGGETLNLKNGINELSKQEDALSKEYDGVFDMGESEKSEIDQGNYTGDAINVFNFTDIQDLKRLFVHEFGHALGLEHSEDEYSIMSTFNTDKSEIVTAADLKKAQEYCAPFE